MKDWVKMPSRWLIYPDGQSPLTHLKWSGDQKSDRIAALMIYIVLVQHANDSITAEFSELGLCRLTYERLSNITGLSKAKISGGIQVLKELDIVAVLLSGRSNIYKVVDFGHHNGWAKLPCKGMYSKDLQRIPVFHEFKLRSKVELNALKLYLVILSLRSNSTNYANIGYEKIRLYSGIAQNDIRSAVSLLISQGWVHVDQRPSAHNAFSTSNMYRPCHIDTRRHKGTTARAMA